MAKPSWITLSKTSGFGNGTVSASASAHSGRNSRSGSIAFTTGVGNITKTVSVTQNGAAASVAISNNAFSGDSIGNGAATYNITGTANTSTITILLDSTTDVALFGGAQLTANGNTVNFVQDSSNSNLYTATVTGDPGASASFSYTIKVTTTANPTTNTRTLKYAVGGASATSITGITATQIGANPTFSVNPTEVTFTAAAGSQTITITSNTSWEIA